MLRLWRKYRKYLMLPVPKTAGARRWITMWAAFNIGSNTVWAVEDLFRWHSAGGAIFEIAAITWWGANYYRAATVKFAGELTRAQRREQERQLLAEQAAELYRRNVRRLENEILQLRLTGRAGEPQDPLFAMDYYAEQDAEAKALAADNARKRVRSARADHDAIFDAMERHAELEQARSRARKHGWASTKMYVPNPHDANDN